MVPTPELVSKSVLVLSLWFLLSLVLVTFHFNLFLLVSLILSQSLVASSRGVTFCFLSDQFSNFCFSGISLLLKFLVYFLCYVFVQVIMSFTFSFIFVLCLVYLLPCLFDLIVDTCFLLHASRNRKLISQPEIFPPGGQ